MEELVELYLFKNKKCPLPEIGSLQLSESNAVAWYVEKKLEAPVPVIKLTEDVIATDDFIAFIASKKNVDKAQAHELLLKFCGQLQNLDAFSERKLPHAGKFYVNADGALLFKSIEVPKEYMPDVAAERVLHPTASHNMVVGDKERTSTEMAAYYATTEEESRKRWWIWAAAFFVMSVAVITLYWNNPSSTINFGNAVQVVPAPEPITYMVAE